MSVGTPTSGDFDVPSGYLATQYAAVLPTDRYDGASPVPTRFEMLAALAVAVVVAALGFPLGALWSALAPWLPAVQQDSGPVYADPEGEQLIAAEGWYLFITVLAGIALAVLVWVLLRRYRGVALGVALAAGAVAAGILTYWTGHHIGLAHARYLAEHA